VSTEYIEHGWPWQDKALALSQDMPFYALHMEQRTGKTRIILQTAARHYLRGTINALLIIAWPSGVHRNWVTDEAPRHLPPTVRWKGIIWDSRRARQVGFQEQLEKLIAFKGLAILSLNAEAIAVEDTRKFLSKFLAKRKLVVAADEYTFFTSPGSTRNRVMQGIGKNKNVLFRRIMDGTPGEDPFDLYAPFKFLHRGIFKCDTFTAFKNFFADWEDEKIWVKDGKGGSKQIDIKKFKTHRNLDKLQQWMAPYVFRVTREECGGLPKLYLKRYVDLSPEQARVYGELHSEYKAELHDGREVTAAHALTRYLRLQQVTSNLLPGQNITKVCPACNLEGCEACNFLGVKEERTDPVVVDKEHHPRLEAFEHELSRNQVPVLVWARFTTDVDAVLAVAKKLGRSFGRFDGTMDIEAKFDNLKRFQAGELDGLAGNPLAGGRGLRMDKAKLIINYSQLFGLRARQQSEDRAEAIGKTDQTSVLDFVSVWAGGPTVDEIVLTSHRAKKEVMDYIHQDRGGQWL
jgi:hypothetical protein